MLVVLGTARVADIAWKFIRLVGLLTLGMSCLATAWVYRGMSAATTTPSWWWVVGCGSVLGVGAMAVVVAAPMVSRAPTAIHTLSLLAGAGGLAGSALSCSFSMAPQKYISLTTNMITLGQVLSSWLLGSITVAWLLGHAYLTATKMTIAPLRYFSRMLSAAVAARLVFLIVVLAASWLMQDGSAVSIWTRLEQWWIIVLLRVGVGLVALAIFAYMVGDCVRLRSTQSATGILYFASLMAYVGELASQFLTRELGWPI